LIFAEEAHAGPIVLQIERKNHGLANVFHFPARNRRNERPHLVLFNSLKVIAIHGAGFRHSIAFVKDNLAWNITYGTRDRGHGDFTEIFND
jgi:hypothetical protein